MNADSSDVLISHTTRSVSALAATGALRHTAASHELILFLGSQPAGDASHKPGGRLPLLSARPAVTLATL